MQQGIQRMACCSGLIIAGLALPGNTSAALAQLYITEIMANPSAVSDTRGEWFELYNPLAVAVDLDGVVISDDGSNSHTINSGGSLLIQPGHFFVLGRDGDSTSNGGYSADYVYSNFSLGNSSDQIILTDLLGEQLRLDYNSGFVTAGASSELTGLPMAAANYATATVGYGDRDLGTPGFSNYSYESTSPVPLPAGIWLFGSGIAAMLGLVGRRRQR